MTADVSSFKPCLVRQGGPAIAACDVEDGARGHQESSAGLLQSSRRAFLATAIAGYQLTAVVRTCQ